MKHLIYLLFIIIFFYLYICLKKKTLNETFISKIKLDKHLIVVMMEGTIGDNYKGTIKSLCENYIDKCTYNFNKNKIDNSKKINITYDKSFKTSTKKKNTNYLVVYKKNKKNSYNNKFIKKWCSDAKQNKDNFIVINYDNIYSESEELLDKIENKFKINIPMKGMLKYGSLKNVNLEEIKNIASNVSMNNLAKQFMNKI
jgi:hypothetical protein